jgi:dihydropteroate synthase
MGIINTTPDSFYAGSRTKGFEDLLTLAGRMLEEGAAILDIGGQSTRPGSQRLGASEERDRVIPAVKALSRAFPKAILSIDTFYGEVAEAAADAGASIINDVSGGSIDPLLLPTVARLKLPYVLMHMQGHPETMQERPFYENVTVEVFDALNRQLAQLREAGLADIIIDPGFGFGKTIEHNFTLLRELSFFHQLNCPLLVGISRKGTIYKTLGRKPEEALNGSTVLHTVALQQGAQLLRVHDVREAVEAITLLDAAGLLPNFD